MPHLSPEALLDLAEQSGGDRPAHLESCAECRAQLSELRDILQGVAAVDVPEPSPLFWEHLSDRVRQAVAAEPPAPRPLWSIDWMSWKIALPAAGLALVLLAVLIGARTTPRTAAPVAGVAMADAAVDIQAADSAAAPEPVSWTLISDLAAGLDREVVVEAGLAPTAADVDRALYDLTPEERRELHRLLQAELSGSPL